MALNLKKALNDAFNSYNETSSVKVSNTKNATNASVMLDTSPPSTNALSSNTVPVSEVSQPIVQAPTITTRNTTTGIADQLKSVTSQAQTIQTALDKRKEQETIDSLPGKILELMNKDTSEEKQQIRDDAGLAEKEAFAQSLSNRLIERDNYYRDELERIEKNPEGKLRGALNSDINKLERERSRELADLSFSYQVALGDYQAAQNLVDTRISDMEADIQNDISTYQMAYEYARDDMTEREKLEIQQNFEKEMQARTVAYDKEIADYNHQLQMSEIAYRESFNVPNVADTGAFQSETESTLSTLSLMRDTISRIKGREGGDDQEAYDALYKAAGANPTAEWFRRNLGSRSTDFTRLNTYVDTLKSNMLMLGSDPNIRDFFGPQMSERDVDMMMSSATALQTANQNPTEVLSEVQRIEQFIGKYEAAVQAKSGNYLYNPNVVIAPDGTAIEIIQ